MRTIAFARKLLIVMVCGLGLTSARGQWLLSQRSADVAYFLYPAPARCERYALTNEQWLPPLFLPVDHGAATAAFVDADGIYVAYGRAVYRYDLAGGNETYVLTTAIDVRALIAGPLYLYLQVRENFAGSDNFISVNKKLNAVIDSTNYFYSMVGLSITRSGDKLYGRSIGIGPADILKVDLNANGTFGTEVDSPHHGEYPDATLTWVLPDDQSVVDSSGTVYDAVTLRFTASFGGAVDDIQFQNGSNAIVRRGSEIVACDSRFLPVTSTNLGFTPQNIYLAGSNVFAFTPDRAQSNGIRLDKVNMALLQPPRAGAAVEPVGLAYTPDSQFVGADGFIYLFSAEHSSLFQWNPTNQVYVRSIRLLDDPSYVAYSLENNTAYVGYQNGFIRSLDLRDRAFEQRAFAAVGKPISGLVTAGAYLVATAYFSGTTQISYDRSGRIVDSTNDLFDYPLDSTWNGVNQKIYYVSSYRLTSQEINADGITYPAELPGGIGTLLDSPFTDFGAFAPPVRVAPDGSVVLLGSGVFHDARSLNRLPGVLENEITDAAWSQGELKTVRTIVGLSQFQAWSEPAYAQRVVRQYPGTARSLMTLPGTQQLLAISMIGDSPSFYVLDGEFSLVAPPTLTAPARLSATILSASQIRLSWNDVGGELAYRIERRADGNGPWVAVGSNTINQITFVDTGVSAGHSYAYRVIAGNGAQLSPPSPELSVLLAAPATPTSLTAVPVSTHTIRISWNDVALESGYHLERRRGSFESWTEVRTTGANETNVVDDGLFSDTQYFYQLVAFNGLGESAYSEVVSATTDAEPPAFPSYFHADASDPSRVYLSWSSDGVGTNFIIERTTAGLSWSVIASIPSYQTFYSDQQFEPNTVYEYRLKAVNRLGESDYTPEQSVTTPPLPPPPAPYGVIARPISSSEIELRWYDPIGAKGYRVDRRSAVAGDWITIAVLSSDTRVLLDTGLTAGVVYSYVVRAFNNAGESNPSEQATTTPARVVCVMGDSFEPGLDPLAWESVSGGIATNGGAGFLNGQALWFGGAMIRQAVTAPIDVSQGAYVEFQFRTANETNGGTIFWDQFEFNRWISFDYSIDGGVRWDGIASLGFESSTTNWTAFAFEIPLDARTPRTRFRWRQTQPRGERLDTWALDDVCVRAVAPPAPSAPPFLIAVANGAAVVSVEWIGGNGAFAHVLERREALTGWAQVATLPAAVTYFTDTNALPQRHYTYRVQAINAGGQSPYSVTATAFTWSEWEDWVNTYFGSPDVFGEEAMYLRDTDGVPLLAKFAFNLPPGEPVYTLASGGTSGLPAIWLDRQRKRLVVEFIRRRDLASPGIGYQVLFSDRLTGWASSGVNVQTVPIDLIWERVRYEDAAAKDGAASRFARVGVLRVP